ncbi:MAG: hypothetical protein ACN6OP_22725 [Pseudomonadales bacterium]
MLTGDRFGVGSALNLSGQQYLALQLSPLDVRQKCTLDPGSPDGIANGTGSFGEGRKRAACQGDSGPVVRDAHLIEEGVEARRPMRYCMRAQLHEVCDLMNLPRACALAWFAQQAMLGQRS